VGAVDPTGVSRVDEPYGVGAEDRNPARERLDPYGGLRIYTHATTGVQGLPCF
jgi:hypothetical protein